MFDNLINAWDSVKSYKTVASLEKVLAEKSLGKYSPILVAIPQGKNEGRYTALFALKESQLENAMYIVNCGFKTV